MMQLLFFGLLFVSSALLVGAAMMFWQHFADLRSISREALLTATDSDELPASGNVYRDLRVSASSWMDRRLRANPRVQAVQQYIARSGARLYVDQLFAISTLLALLAAGACAWSVWGRGVSVPSWVTARRWPLKVGAP